MATNNICGTVLGEMTIGTIQMPMVCGKIKGHAVNEGHSPAAPNQPIGMPSDAILKAFGAGVPRPVTASLKPIVTPSRRPLAMRLRHQ